MTIEETLKIISAITYKPGWTVLVAADPGRVIPDGRGGGTIVSDPRWYVQVEVSETSDASLDSMKRDGTRTPWKSGKRYLSPHMCRQEVVGVVFDLIKAAEMHEVHEWFRYKGASIYNPHLDPDVLVEVARKKASFVVRQDAMGMEEAAA